LVRPPLQFFIDQLALPQYLHSRAVYASVFPQRKQYTSGPFAGCRARHLRRTATPAPIATAKLAPAASPILFATVSTTNSAATPIIHHRLPFIPILESIDAAPPERPKSAKCEKGYYKGGNYRTAN
jgi:hypothetical protein